MSVPYDPDRIRKQYPLPVYRRRVEGRPNPNPALHKTPDQSHFARLVPSRRVEEYRFETEMAATHFIDLWGGSKNREAL